LERSYTPHKVSYKFPHLKNKIDWDKFIWTSDFKLDDIGDGFTEYLINKDEPFKHNGNHPDATQHLNFFNDIIYPNFKTTIL